MSKINWQDLPQTTRQQLVIILGEMAQQILKGMPAVMEKNNNVNTKQGTNNIPWENTATSS